MTLRWILAGTALLNMLLAGFYYAYATVISAQRGAEPAGAIAAMARMNQAVERAPFVALFTVAALGAVVSGGWLADAGPRTAGSLVGAAGAVCAVAASVSTVAVNVPLNRRIDAGTITWADFVEQWAPWNAARAVLSVIAAAGLLVAAAR